jgi:hypothetical protein
MITLDIIKDWLKKQLPKLLSRCDCSKWIGIDNDSCVWGFEKKPYMVDGEWMPLRNSHYHAMEGVIPYTLEDFNVETLLFTVEELQPEEECPKNSEE